MDFWVGLRAQTIYRTYDANVPEPLIEKVVSGVFSYSDGALFDVAKGNLTFPLFLIENLSSFLLFSSRVSTWSYEIIRRMYLSSPVDLFWSCRFEL
jgi:hypothetical protein